MEALAKEKGVSLPADMLQTASKFGLRASVLNTFFAALKVIQLGPHLGKCV